MSYELASKVRIARLSRKTFFDLPPFLVLFAVLLFVGFGFGANIPLAILAIAVLVIGGGLLWRPSEPPIMLFAFFYQWVQASIAIFYANAIGVDLNEVPNVRTQSLTFATVLSLLAVFVMAVGLRIGIGPSLNYAASSITMQKPLKFWLKFYIGVLLLSLAATSAAYVVPALSQIMLAIASLKWAGYIAFTIAIFSRPGANRLLWLIAFLFEFFLSLGGLFSDFKMVFFYTLIALATISVRLTPHRVLTGFALGSSLLALSLIWTAIKVDYRTFITGGQSSQMVLVDRVEAVEKLVSLAANVDGQKLEEAVRDLVMRISYVEFFGGVLDTVPSVIPHEGGSLWTDAIRRPFMPRLFFPDKAEINDSDLVNKYTNIPVAGASEGTSISIGYIGETYIDFGEYAMMGVLFIFWASVGRFCTYLISTKKAAPFFGMVLICPLLMECSHIEGSLAKMVGAVSVYALVYWGALNFLLPRYITMVSR